MLFAVVGQPVQRAGRVRLAWARVVLDQWTGQPPVPGGQLVQRGRKPAVAADPVPVVVIQVAGGGRLKERFGPKGAVARAAGVHRGPQQRASRRSGLLVAAQ
ncbi:hypothetical protein [Actinomadura chibensis]|uniref:Uncharacterized protein n=1 Tax=Actinomadura chibensis TaxID=392828 RepID=A0A5D0NP80_9ACTN|nr:hypothetical protein [Actinomadura chibensis]TYB46363.1 hypothetical protein FXF69_13940 [Actinomadura chibensis]